MALSNNTHSQTTFLSIVNGKICRKVTKDTEGAVERTNKNGVLIYELQWTSLIGIIESISIRQSEEYGDQWEIMIRDVTDTYKLQLPISGRVTNGLMFRLPNIDLSSEVELNTFINKEGKPVLLVKQNGVTVKQAYTKDNPNGLPQLESIVFKGKEQWDDTKQQAFIKNMVETQIQPKLKKAAAPVAPPTAPPQGENNADDLPF